MNFKKRQEKQFKRLFKSTPVPPTLPLALTVTLVTSVDSPFQGLCLCELGQHLSEQALCLIQRDKSLFYAVIAFREFQGQIPKGLNGIGFIIA